MRISSDPDDPGYEHGPSNYRVLLDGKMVSWITADDEIGEAKIALVEDGKPVINPMTGLPWLVWRTGKVEFLRVQ